MMDVREIVIKENEFNEVLARTMNNMVKDIQIQVYAYFRKNIYGIKQDILILQETFKHIFKII